MVGGVRGGGGGGDNGSDGTIGGGGEEGRMKRCVAEEVGWKRRGRFPAK